MLSSIRIAKIAGVDIKVHSTFFLLLLWIFFSNFGSTRSWESALGSAGFIILLFGIVTLHEFGHAFAASKFGIKTKQILLMPIGGLASLDRIPEDPIQELIVAIAGPLVNVALAILCFAILSITGQTQSITSTNGLDHNLIVRLFWTNISLIVFNMLPAFPMDGGRVLRSILSMIFGRSRATLIAARLGQGIAVLLGLLGLAFEPILILTAFFVWSGAQAELNLTRFEESLSGLLAQQVMSTQLSTLSSDTDLYSADQYASQTIQTDFPVTVDDVIVGSISKRTISDALQNNNGRLVNDVMNHHIVTVRPDEPLKEVLKRWQQSGSEIALVVRDNETIGIITARQVAQQLASLRAQHQTSIGSFKTKRRP